MVQNREFCRDWSRCDACVGSCMLVRIYFLRVCLNLFVFLCLLLPELDRRGGTESFQPKIHAGMACSAICTHGEGGGWLRGYMLSVPPRAGRCKGGRKERSYLRRSRSITSIGYAFAAAPYRSCAWVRAGVSAYHAGRASLLSNLRSSQLWWRPRCN